VRVKAKEEDYLRESQEKPNIPEEDDFETAELKPSSTQQSHAKFFLYQTARRIDCTGRKKAAKNRFRQECSEAFKHSFVPQGID